MDPIKWDYLFLGILKSPFLSTASFEYFLLLNLQSTLTLIEQTKLNFEKLNFENIFLLAIADE